MYYRARKVALNNNHGFHIAAFTKVRGSYLWGINSDRKSVRFERKYPDGTYGYHLHAEMDLIRKLPKGSVREISVIRFMKNGDVTMAKPCSHCQNFLKKHGIIRVRYTNWNGEWEVMEL